MAKRKEVMESLLKASSTNIQWQGFSIWNVLRNDQKEELDKSRLALIIIIKASRFYSASRHVFTPPFIGYPIHAKVNL
jgi:hypothetical protein